MNNRTTRSKLIAAAFEILSTEGFHLLTIRRVAERAGVNIAAVNYHFGSRDALAAEAAELFQRKTREVFAVLEEQDLAPHERFRLLAHRFANHLHAYPGFLRTFITAVARGDDPPEAARRSIIAGREMVVRAIRPLLESDDETVRTAVVQLMAAIVYPMVIGDRMEDLYGVPFGDSAYRREYVDRLLHTFGLGQ
jgi:AcrR family transcriptional regulator